LAFAEEGIRKTGLYRLDLNQRNEDNSFVTTDAILQLYRGAIARERQTRGSGEQNNGMARRSVSHKTLEPPFGTTDGP